MSKSAIAGVAACKRGTKFDVEAETEGLAHANNADLSTARGSLNVILAAASDVNHGYLTEGELLQIVNYVETC